MSILDLAIWFRMQINICIIYTGVTSVLLTVCNAHKGPWLSGAIGKELAEALGCLFSLPSDHEFVARFLEGVLIDNNLTPHDAEHQMPDFQKRLLVSSPFATRETIWAESLDVS